MCQQAKEGPEEVAARPGIALTRDLAGIIACAFLKSGCYTKSKEHNIGRATHDTSCSAAELLFPFLTEGEKMAFFRMY